MAIPYPTGDPELEPEAEKAFRRHMVEVSLKALCTDIDDQTVFERE